MDTPGINGNSGSGAASGHGLRVLITNITLRSRTGTETAVRDLALALKSIGHHPIVYTPRPGEIAREIEASGVPVHSRLKDIRPEPDIVHGHHTVETVKAMLYFRKAPGIFVCHDRFSWHDIPPGLSKIRRYVAVDLNTRERLLNAPWIPKESVRVILNWVDTERFTPRPPLPDFPRRALVFSNYAGPNTHLDAVREACRSLGIELDVVGSRSGNPVARPESVLGDYDLVFAKARCAIEAMACGTAVILCDTRGLGPMVATHNARRLRPWNFGMRCLDRPLDASAVKEEIRRYDPEDAASVSAYIREEASLSRAVKEYSALYGEVIAAGEPRPLRRMGAGAFLKSLAWGLGELQNDVRELRIRPFMNRLQRGAS